MKIVVAPDSFKGSLSALEAAQAIETGWRRARPGDTIALCPIADGGEGTARALASDGRGVLLTHAVTHPLYPDRKVNAQIALLQDGETAVVELAQAAGLHLIPDAAREPKITSTFGVGELVQKALQIPSVRRLLITLGGSCSNDGGAGILQALGVTFRDGANNQLAPGGAALENLRFVDFAASVQIPLVEVVIACDVDNPLLGARGAAAVFGPQKGASPADVRLLDTALTRYADVLTAATGRDCRNIPGAGAAGGTAAGLLWLFPNAKLCAGIDIVLNALDFDRIVQDADVVITGEGRLDGQTLGGKAISGVVQRTNAVRPNTRIIALVGSVSPKDAELELAEAVGLQAIHSMVSETVTVAEAIRDASRFLADTAERAALTILTA